MTGIAIRFIPIFREEFKDRLNAVSMRGIDVKRQSLGKKLKLYSYIITPVVQGCIFKSREISEAARARAFRAYKKRTAYRIIKLGAADYIMNILNLGIIAAFVILRVMQ
jgi:energy-coupling factor transport system permease protein